MNRTTLILAGFMALVFAAALPAQEERSVELLEYDVNSMRNYDRALRLYLRKDFARAEELVHEALRINPDALEPRWLLVNIYHKTGRMGLMMSTLTELGVRERIESEYVNELVRSGSSGYVLSNRDTYVTIDLTAEEGSYEGARYVVYQEGDILRHPVTLVIIDVDKPGRGIIEVEEVLDTHSVARVIEQAAPIERGMRVVPEGEYGRILDQMETAESASRPGGSFELVSIDAEYDGLAIRTPEGITVDEFGRLKITDTGNDRIVRLVAGGDFDAAYGVSGSGEEQFRMPVSVVEHNGALYVVERANHRLHILNNETLEHERVIGSRGIRAPGLFTVPQKAISSGGMLYVLDAGNRRVQVLNEEGVFLADDITSEAIANYPTTFAVTDQTVYVLDPEEGIIHAFSRRQPFESLGVIALPEELAGQSIVDMTAFESDGNRYFAFVLDREGKIVITDGELTTVVRSIGTTGPGAGQFSDPVRVYAREGRLFVLERGNMRVQIVSDFI